MSSVQASTVMFMIPRVADNICNKQIFVRHPSVSKPWLPHTFFPQFTSHFYISWGKMGEEFPPDFLVSQNQLKSILWIHEIKERNMTHERWRGISG